MAKKKTSVTDKQKSTWAAFKKTKSNVLRKHEKEIVIQYTKEILNKDIEPKTHKEWITAFNQLNKKILV